MAYFKLKRKSGQKERDKKARCTVWENIRKKITGYTAIPTVIDGEKIDDLRVWVVDQVRKGLEARDELLPDFGGAWGTSRSYAEHCRSNYRYYRSLLTQLQEELGSDASNDSVVHNKLYQKMRNKMAIIIQNALSWRYRHIDLDDSQEIQKINKVLPSRLRNEGYNECLVDMIAQVSSFGTAIGGYLHSNAIEEPEGACFFQCLDPMSYLWEFNKTKINGRSNKTTRIFIYVDYAPKSRLEREYGKKINFENPMVNIEDFSLLHNLSMYKGKSLGIDDDIVRIQIWIDDETSESIKRPEPSMVPKIIPTTGEFELDEDGNEVMIPETDVDGNPVYKLVSTGERRMKYPQGRKIVFCGHTKCYDDVNPDKHGRKPFFKIQNTRDGLSFQGMSDPELGASIERALFRVGNNILEHIEQSVGIVEIDESILTKTDDRDGFEKDGPFYVARVRPKFPGQEAVRFKQPTMVTQDAFILLRNLDSDLSDIIGSQPVSHGNSYASESGAKVEIEDSKIIRFHTAIFEEMRGAIDDVAMMWLLNFWQYDKRPKPYPYKNPDDGKEEYIMMAGADILQNSKMLQDGIFTNREMLLKHTPVDIVPSPLHITQREESVKKLIEMKGVMPEGIPNYALLKRMDDPDLIEEGARQERMERVKMENLEAQNKVLKAVEERGLLDRPPAGANADRK